MKNLIIFTLFSVIFKDGLFLAASGVGRSCIDVPSSERQDCSWGWAETRSKCLHRGCCYSESNEIDVPSCFLSPEMYSAECIIPENEYKVDCGHGEIVEEECLSNGCCWRPANDGTPWCFLKVNATITGGSDNKCTRIPQNKRQDCSWGYAETYSTCTHRGCCFDPIKDEPSVPSCFLTEEMFSAECTLPDDYKVDCGNPDTVREECHEIGCCWRPSNDGTPWCFQKANMTTLELGGGKDNCNIMDVLDCPSPGFENISHTEFCSYMQCQYDALSDCSTEYLASVNLTLDDIANQLDTLCGSDCKVISVTSCYKEQSKEPTLEELCSAAQCLQDGVKDCSDEQLAKASDGMMSKEMIASQINLLCVQNEGCNIMGFQNCGPADDTNMTAEEKCSAMHCMQDGLKNCSDEQLRMATDGMMSKEMIASQIDLLCESGDCNIMGLIDCQPANETNMSPEERCSVAKCSYDKLKGCDDETLIAATYGSLTKEILDTKLAEDCGEQ